MQARIVTGMHGDGMPDGTNVTLVDPARSAPSRISARYLVNTTLRNVVSLRPAPLHARRTK